MGISNKKKGLRTTPYCTSDELVQWLKLSTLCSELEACAKETQNKEWRRMMNCARGLVWKVVLGRIDLLDDRQKRSVIRRHKHSIVKLITSDEDRLNDSDQVQDRINIAFQDLIDIYDLASNSCAACPQGECVKNCFYRNNFHRLGLPVTRDNPKEGECEFNWQAVGETSQIKPQNTRAEHYYVEDYNL